MARLKPWRKTLGHRMLSGLGAVFNPVTTHTTYRMVGTGANRRMVTKKVKMTHAGWVKAGLTKPKGTKLTYASAHRLSRQPLRLKAFRHTAVGRAWRFWTGRR